MDMGRLQMDNMWLDNTFEVDRQDPGPESLLDRVDGARGPAVPEAPCTPLIRPLGDLDKNDGYAELASLPPYEGMERLWREEAMDAAIGQSMDAADKRLAQARALYEQRPLTNGSPLGNIMEQAEAPGYEYPVYGERWGGMP